MGDIAPAGTCTRLTAPYDIGCHYFATADVAGCAKIGLFAAPARASIFRFAEDARLRCAA